MDPFDLQFNDADEFAAFAAANYYTDLKMGLLHG